MGISDFFLLVGICLVFMAFGFHFLFAPILILILSACFVLDYLVRGDRED